MLCLCAIVYHSVLSRNATNPDFLPSRHPSEFRGRRGNARKEKRRQHLQAGLQSGRNVPQIRGGGQTRYCCFALPEPMQEK